MTATGVTFVVPVHNGKRCVGEALAAILAQSGEQPVEVIAVDDGSTVLTWRIGNACATIREQLLAHGKASNTPVALIERGTQPSQRVIRGTLDQLPALAVGVESPALIMVGSVVTLADQLAWFGQGGAADAALASA